VPPKVERLVNLTVALLEARQPMTFAEIRRRTRFYEQDDAESARRMFERDKDELRRLGVPVEVRDLSFGDELGYIVDRDAYELEDIDLTPEEVASLAMAVRLTGAEGEQLALSKLVARAPDAAELATRPTTRIALRPDPVDDVGEAVLARQTVRFTYRTAAGDRAERTVDPYGIVQRRAAWYLVGRDHDRDAVRAFRLDRMEGRPRAAGERGGFTPPPDLDIASAVAGPESVPVDVELAVAPGARWSVELRGGIDTGRTHDGMPVLRVDGLDPLRDRSWLLGLGPEVVVLAPAELRDEVIAGLRALAGAPHGGRDRNGEATSERSERDVRGGGRERNGEATSERSEGDVRGGGRDRS
jgi:proteasome accessory factor B